MGENLLEKEYYKEKIIEQINKIDDVKMLVYLFTFISCKTKKRE